MATRLPRLNTSFLYPTVSPSRESAILCDRFWDAVILDTEHFFDHSSVFCNDDLDHVGTGQLNAFNKICKIRVDDFDSEHYGRVGRHRQNEDQYRRQAPSKTRRRYQRVKPVESFIPVDAPPSLPMVGPNPFNNRSATSKVSKGRNIRIRTDLPRQIMMPESPDETMSPWERSHLSFVSTLSDCGTPTFSPKTAVNFSRPGRTPSCTPNTAIPRVFESDRIMETRAPTNYGFWSPQTSSRHIPRCNEFDFDFVSQARLENPMSNWHPVLCN